jgi:hypothetical protein
MQISPRAAALVREIDGHATQISVLQQEYANLRRTVRDMRHEIIAA